MKTPNLDAYADSLLARTRVILPGQRPSAAISEDQRLAELRLIGHVHLKMRIAMLVRVGWKRTDLATMAGVSRVTIHKWLSDLETLVQNPSQVSALDQMVFHPIQSKLSPGLAASKIGLEWQSDKFVVPAGFVDPLRTMWRVAYRSRGPSLTTSTEIMAVSDALDMTVGVLLRRGVTHAAIARAAGVTRRGSVDRITRARQRASVVKCYQNGVCENFPGEGELVTLMTQRSRDTSLRVTSDDLADASDQWLTDLPADDLSIVQLTSARPTSVFWARILFDGAQPYAKQPPINEASVVLDEWTAAKLVDPRLGLLPDTVIVPGLSEIAVAASVGRFNAIEIDDDPATTVIRSNLIALPTKLLYLSSVEKMGALPKTPRQALASIPVGLRSEFMDEHSLVMDCWNKASDVLDDFAEIPRHGDDAKTRRAS